MEKGEIKSRLKEYFAAQPVDVAYLFGSVAEGKNNSNSDLDVGVLFQQTLSEQEKFDLRLQYMSQVGRLTGKSDRVDVVDIEKAPVTLAYSILKPVEIVIETNHDRASQNRYRILNRYRRREYPRRQYRELTTQHIAEFGLS